MRSSPVQLPIKWFAVTLDTARRENEKQSKIPTGQTVLKAPESAHASYLLKYSQLSLFRHDENVPDCHSAFASPCVKSASLVRGFQQTGG